ncbi:MAG: PaaI family thioesterase [Halioglobus sp.]
MVTKDALEAFFVREFPQAQFTIESVGRRSASICRTVSERDLRPGGTVSGPTLMELADTALYVAILGEIGLVALAVTTNLNINFLRKPSPDRNLIAQCRLIKVGKTLVVGEVSMFSEGDAEPVAHATGTYSIPPARAARPDDEPAG